MYCKSENFTLYHGDNRQILPTFAENSVDAIVTDPPYELGFMGKSWDASGVAFDPATWREALRVLKPGGHLIAFSGSRTYHRMAVAIEDAGFEIRDQIMWIYGSGFPKSHNIEKAINKIDGVEFIEKPASGVGFMNAEGAGGYNTTINQLEQVGDSTERASKWEGWGTALKPAHEPMVLARKPLIGTVAANVLTYGTGGLNIDASRVPSDDGFEKAWDKPVSTNISSQSGNFDVGSGGKRISNLTDYKPTGRWPANVIHDGSDEVVALFPDKAGNKWKRNYGVEDYEGKQYAGGSFGGGGYNGVNTYADSGSAARFFYCAKASKRDRNEGLNGFEEKRDHDGREEGGVGGSNPRNRTNNYRQNHHPTVKPTDLMRYLCRLITPPNGTVLDPFMGSGSTGKAAMYEGFKFIGIEMTDDYLPIAKARIEFAVSDNEGFLL
jgi:DNA modification methylase